MSGLKIRRAHAEDSLPIARIHVETWHSTYAGIIPDDYLTQMSLSDSTVEWARRLSFLRIEGSTLVAVSGQEVVGFVSCGPGRDKEGGQRGEIYALYVALDWQDQGVGRALLAGAFEELLKDGHRSAEVWVLSRNPSRFFYEAVGASIQAQRLEAFAGTRLEETAYGWEDISTWLAELRAGS